MQYQIEKGIVMPERANLRREKSPLRLALEQMEIGDSIVVDRDHESRVHPLARNAGINIAARRQPDGTTRVWRVVDKS